MIITTEMIPKRLYILYITSLRNSQTHFISRHPYSVSHIRNCRTEVWIIEDYHVARTDIHTYVHLDHNIVKLAEENISTCTYSRAY